MGSSEGEEAAPACYEWRLVLVCVIGSEYLAFLIIASWC